MTIYNLPPQLTPFVGRRPELAEIARLLADPDCRLLTLVGPGGIGKSRLALQAASAEAERYADGVYFVALDHLDSPECLVGAIAEALGFEFHDAGDPRRRLLDNLSGRQMLLLLDNLEHLLDGVGLISDILAAAPNVKVIATSREALNLQEEWLYTVPGMGYPGVARGQDEPQMPPEQFSAVQLFLQCARRMRTDFSLERELDGVIQICSLVEGMPLAIELAATWVRSLSCLEIAKEIERSLDFLQTSARNMPPRHRSMRAVLDQSWALLTPAEREVFRRLGVLRGGFTRAAAQAISGASLQLLSALVDKSLLRWESGGRYGLHNLLQQYAVERLEETPAEAIRTRDLHCRYYTDLLHDHWETLTGSRAKEAMDEIEGEIENVRAAWKWAGKNHRVQEIGRAANTLGLFYDTRSWYQEGEQRMAWVAKALRGLEAGPERDLALGRVLVAQGTLCNSLNRSIHAAQFLDEAVTIFRRLDAREDLAFALARRAEVAAFDAQYQAASHLFEESLALFKAAGNRWGMAFVTNWLGNLAFESDADEKAQRLCQQALTLFQEIGNEWGLAIVLPSLAYAALGTHEYDKAIQYGKEGFALCWEIGMQWGMAMSLDTVGGAHFALGDYPEAMKYYRKSLRIALDVQLARFIARALYGMARTFEKLGQPDRALDALALALHYLALAGLEGEIAYAETFLSPEVFAEAMKRSHTIRPEKALATLLADDSQVPATTSAPAVTSPSASAPDALTEREREILRLVAEGRSNREIAEQLIFAVGTVKWYLNQIYGKLGVASRTQAVAQARELGLLN